MIWLFWNCLCTILCLKCNSLNINFLFVKLLYKINTTPVIMHMYQYRYLGKWHSCMITWLSYLIKNKNTYRDGFCFVFCFHNLKYGGINYVITGWQFVFSNSFFVFCIDTLLFGKMALVLAWYNNHILLNYFLQSQWHSIMLARTSLEQQLA